MAVKQASGPDAAETAVRARGLDQLWPADRDQVATPPAIRFQVARIERRFRLPPDTARVIAEHAFGQVRA
jgi:hypothetical protein